MNQSIQPIVGWFNIAKPNPTNQDIVKQVAFHCEEFAEMLDAIRCNYMAGKVRELQDDLMRVAASNQEASDRFMSSIDNVKLLDALCDQVVTATGIATYMGMKFIPALDEVNRSNYTKFATDEQGNYVPYIRPDGKIGKNPDTYQEPDLEPFVY